MNNKDPFNHFNHFSKQKKKKGGSDKPANFIEALKDLGNSVKKQTKEVTSGTAKNALEQISGHSGKQTVFENKQRDNSEPAFDFEEYLKSRDEQIKYRERKRFESKREQEKAVKSKRDKEIEQQIKLLQEELKKLAQETNELDKEVKKATKQEIVDPGVYHLNFLDHIKQIVILARKQIADSKTWMQTWQNRNSKKSHYWGNVKKSGTKYMLSHERYMVTQKG